MEWMTDSCDSSVPQCDMDKVSAGTLQERINNKEEKLVYRPIKRLNGEKTNMTSELIYWSIPLWEVRLNNWLRIRALT